MSNKVSSKNPKNENFEDYKGKVHSLLSKTASNLFKDKYFYEEFKGVFLFSSGLKIVSSLLSFCTCVLAVQIATKLLFGYYLSMFFAVVVALCIEAVKTFLWRINSKWILKYKELSKGILISLVGLHLVSLAVSAYGGWMLPTLVDGLEIETPVLLERKKDLNKLNSSLDGITTEISKTTAEVEKTSSNSTKRSLNANLSLLLSQRAAKQSEISKIKEGLQLENSKIKASTEEKNKLQESEYLEEIKTAQISCLIASLFFELLFVISSCFNVYYLFRFEIDKEGESQSTNTNTIASNGNNRTASDGENLLSRQQGEKAPEIEAKKISKPNQIGFVSNTRHDSKKTALEDKEVSCHDSKTDSKTDSKICALDGCGNRWKGGQHNKKYCGDSCRKLDYQIRVYKNQSSVKKSKSQKS